MSGIAETRAPLFLSYGYWSAPFRGIPPCGDAAAIHQLGSTYWLLVIDAIGHGPVAARIAQRIISIFDEVLQSETTANFTPSQMLIHFHAALFSRHRDEQAALGVFSFDLLKAQLNLAMVGNLDALLLNPTVSVRLHSQNGMVGGRMPSHLKEASYPLMPNSALAVFSDGMRFSDLAADLPGYVYPESGCLSLSTTAKALVEGFRRQYDDSSCALVRIEPLTHG